MVSPVKRGLLLGWDGLEVYGEVLRKAVAIVVAGNTEAVPFAIHLVVDGVVLGGTLRMQYL